MDVSRVHVVGLGRNLEVPFVDRDWSCPRFLFVGQDWERKNAPAVLDAFAVLRRRHRNACLDIVGPDRQVDMPGVVSHGPLGRTAAERQKLVSLFQRATCFVMPSLFEPFGIVYAEAAAAGLPIVGTSVGGARDIVAPGAGDLVDPADHRALLAAMDRLTHPDVARESGRVAQTRANLFTWPLVASRLLRALGLLSPMHGAPEFLDATVR